MKLFTWQIKNAIREHSWEDLARLISNTADEPEIYKLYERLGVTENFLSSSSSEPSVTVRLGKRKWSFYHGELLFIKINDMRSNADNPDNVEYFRVWYKP